jgi:hypothetical protein
MSLEKSLIRTEFVSNCWYDLANSNFTNLVEQNKKIVGKFCSKVNKIEGYDNLFCVDGWSQEVVHQIIKNICFAKKYDQSTFIPNTINKSGKTLFYNNAESYSQDEIFLALHLIIEFCGLEGEIYYANCAYNLQDVYESFCRRNWLQPKVQCFYNDMSSFFSVECPHYNLPTTLTESPFIDKKTFCSFNWNPWPHRMGLIVLLHYYDLLDYSYVTSPGITKYAYHEDDFDFLEEASKSYINSYSDSEKIYKKLKNLKSNYPLRIDDRSKYTETDQGLTNRTNKIPIVTARLNSLFEIVAETKFNGDHFFSEKTFNPILMSKPILIMSSANILKSFKKLGFKSYGSFIDESYDNIENDSDRLRAIVLEIKRINDFRIHDPLGFKKWYKELQIICQYNLEFFMSTANRPHNNNMMHLEYMRYMNVNI